MTNTTLYLPSFHLASLRRKPRTAAQKLAQEKAKIRRHSISQLGECFGQFIPTQALKNEKGSSQAGRVVGGVLRVFGGTAATLMLHSGDLR